MAGILVRDMCVDLNSSQNSFLKSLVIIDASPLQCIPDKKNIKCFACDSEVQLPYLLQCIFANTFLQSRVDQLFRCLGFPTL